VVGTLPPGVKIAGVKGFTYEELAKASKNFSPENEIGQGGYGKVYRGTLEDDTIVGIKRALKESMQGAHQFYTEIELLSRLHHRNLVQLIGYCNDKGEQVSISPLHQQSFQVFTLQLSSSIHGSKSMVCIMLFVMDRNVFFYLALILFPPTTCYSLESKEQDMKLKNKH
jgi:serine/threonine protein kinase